MWNKCNDKPKAKFNNFNRQIHSSPPTQKKYVDENSLLPILLWISCYNFSNSLKTPLINKPTNNELCFSLILQLTNALRLNQLIAIGLNQTPNRFIAQKVNRFSINHYDFNVTRYMEDSPYDDDPNINPQLTEKFFINLDYIFHLDSTKKKIRQYHRSRINNYLSS